MYWNNQENYHRPKFWSSIFKNKLFKISTKGQKNMKKEHNWWVLLGICKEATIMCYHVSYAKWSLMGFKFCATTNFCCSDHSDELDILYSMEMRKKMFQPFNTLDPGSCIDICNLKKDIFYKYNTHVKCKKKCYELCILFSLGVLNN